MKSLSASLAIIGAVYLASTVALAVTQAPLGSPVFFACAAAAGAAYLLMLARVWNETLAPRRLLTAAFLLAVAFRAPSASICPLCATSRTTSGFQAYASASHSLLPVHASQRHRTIIVIRSHKTSASFIARVESWIDTTSLKNSWAPGGYGVGVRRLGIRRVSAVCTAVIAGSAGTTR